MGLAGARHLAGAGGREQRVPSAIQGNRNSRFRASNFVKNLLLKVFG